MRTGYALATTTNNTKHGEVKWLILVALLCGYAAVIPCDECDPVRGDGDCCHSGPSPACSSRQREDRLEGLQCRRTKNISLDYYFPDSVEERAAYYWMISACPDSWLATTTSSQAAAIQSNCTSATDLLPPVSDNATGIVYRNEYCAVCNGVESAVRWRYGLGCTSWLQLEMFRAVRGTVIFELTVDVINRECLICSYEPPLDASLEAKARACYPYDVSSCLPRESLSPLIDYELAAELCASGPFNPVWAFNLGTLYRNEHCAQCNNVTLTSCFPFFFISPPSCTDEAEPPTLCLCN